MDGLTGTKGGAGVWQRIISEMPEHEVYIEPFWGRGTIAKRKRPAAVTIGIDLDPDAIKSGDGHALMFRADGVQWLKDYFRRQAAPDGEYSVDQSTRDSSASADGATFGGAARSRHLVYLDPPYLGCSRYYKHELTEAQHVDLCRLFKALPCPAMLSGYMSDVYAAELRGTRSIQIDTTNRAGQRCVEWVWFNFDPPRQYHDTRFVGNGRRERERIRKRVKRWSDGLAKMSPAERQAVFEGCAGVFGG